MRAAHFLNSQEFARADHPLLNVSAHVQPLSYCAGNKGCGVKKVGIFYFSVAVLLYIDMGNYYVYAHPNETRDANPTRRMK